ncbi:helix-turn-helix transcriptional regulator [Novosphingobium aerophilum]|uniref:helix-turn-helix transcriptional regulator n=1 Tax=Novosphingobium TaxID=165696 RepID=UPI0006C8BA34|nr:MULTISPECIES: helix-turn-helix transcriptional regulator [unclassified Novosphingobium]KPH58939.1 XRE family transcriptional regulator [Novosphingobium sp. ST904]TCM37151.1 DNA-binding XRE family transcriptional regulator [Novosphingobium sp. ST904]WRT94514.1 helix-turn-helix transcriptional regulator [Novosphingobium sp. RL4]
MINRIRDIRLQKGLTLADVAAACEPQTTPQTIGRLETGMRNLSLVWMNRIARALQVEPESLLRSEANAPAMIVAVLSESGAESPRTRREAVLPSDLAAETPWMVMEVEGSCGEYRTADQVWLRQGPAQDAARLLNRDVLVPLPGGRFAFGRLIEITGETLSLLPPVSGQRPVPVEHPQWIAVAEMLVRKL